MCRVFIAGVFGGVIGATLSIHGMSINTVGYWVVVAGVGVILLTLRT